MRQAKSRPCNGEDRQPTASPAWRGALRSTTRILALGFLLIWAFESQNALLVPVALAADEPSDDTTLIASNLSSALDCPPCVVVIRSYFPGNRFSQGTGVLLKNGKVLTARHVVKDDWDRRPERLEVIFGGRNAYPETDALKGQQWRIDYTQRESDLAVISGCVVPRWAKGARRSNALVKEGDTLASVGLEHPGSIRLHAAQVVELETEKPHILLKVQSQRGNSGGPVFNKKGELVGIVSALEQSLKQERKVEQFGNLTLTSILVETIPATCVIELKRVGDLYPDIAKLMRD